MSVAGDQLFGRCPPLVGEQHRGVLMTEVLDVKLAEGVAVETNRLFVHPGRAVLAGRDVELDRPPRRTRKTHDVLHDLRRPPAEGDEVNLQAVQFGQLGVGRQPGVEDQVARKLAAGPLPEVDEPEDLPGLFSLADVGIGITEGPAVGVLGQKDQNACLAPAPGRDIVALYLGGLAVIGHGVKIEVERFAPQESGSGKLFLPGSEQPGGLGVTETGGVLREIALLGNGVETGKKSQALVGRQGHDMALAFDRPELQGQ